MVTLRDYAITMLVMVLIILILGYAPPKGKQMEWTYDGQRHTLTIGKDRK